MEQMMADIESMGGELFVNFYSPYKGRISDVEVEVLGNYPVSDTAEIKIKSPREVAVNFRVPSWSKNTLINGKAANAGWHKLRIGKGETSIKIEFDMTPRVINSDLSSEYYSVACAQQIHRQHKRGNVFVAERKQCRGKV